MSISERERQALDSMEGELARSDPRLASMLVMFTRLTADERMPAREPVQSVHGEPGPRRPRRFRIGRKARGWLLLAAAAALFASMVIMTHGNRVSACTHALTTTCEQTHARLAGSVPESARPPSFLVNRGSAGSDRRPAPWRPAAARAGAGP